MNRSKKNNSIRLAIVLANSIFIPALLLAQASPIPISVATASQQLSPIFRAYDSMRYVSFDIRIVSGTDTLKGNSRHSEQSGKFSVAGKKYHYSMAGNEVMQNDSFLVSFYKTGKTIVLDRAKPTGATTGLLPGGINTDSILSAFGNTYHIFSDTTANGTRLLLFHANNQQVTYTDITIEYDPQRKLLLSGSYTFYSPDRITDNNSDDPASSTSSTTNNASPTPVTLPDGTVMRKHTMTIYYENYRFDPDSFTNAFIEAAFVRFDGKRYWPVQAYANYQFFNMINQ